MRKNASGQASGTGSVRSLNRVLGLARLTPRGSGSLLVPDGFSIVETLVSVALVGMIMLSIAQLMTVGVTVNKASKDLTEATALASQKMEELRNLDYAVLAQGGDVNNDVANYYDSPDIEADGTVDYNRRWQITDLGGSKIIQVRVMGLLAASGPAKEALVSVLVAQQ